jgi:lipopolysaccharide export system protein LptC
MIAAKQAVWLFITLIGLACSGWYFASAPAMLKLDETTLANTTDMIIDELTVRQYAENGQLINYLYTPRLRHRPSNNTNWLKKPHIILKQDNQPAWEIHAQQATSLYGGQQITLNKHVVAHQQHDAHTAESTFTTEAITYFPSSQRATTLLEIHYEQAGHIMQAMGMNLFLANKHIELLSQARGIYDPSQA